ncbi:MAG TPA: twin-arginine translocase TatA/TatE family subunit [Acidimicrobiales bacterium]
MGNIGGGEVLVILLAALIILGPTKLPEVARQLGRAVGELRKVSSGFQRELREAMDLDDEAEARRRGASVAANRPVPPIVPADPANATPAAGDGHDRTLEPGVDDHS